MYIMRRRLSEKNKFSTLYIILNFSHFSMPGIFFLYFFSLSCKLYHRFEYAKGMKKMNQTTPCVLKKLSINSIEKTGRTCFSADGLPDNKIREE